MACEYCRRTMGHALGCPKYELQKSLYKCAECNENILVGEKYITNHNGEYAHWECVNYPKNLLEFLGEKLKEMEDEN